MARLGGWGRQQATESEMAVDGPVLKPDLRLTLEHAEHVADLLASRCGRASVEREEAFEVDELLGGHPRPLALLARGQLGR